VTGAGAQQWEQEALRLCQRYIDEVVLAFGLCPWAEAALRGGQVARAVCLLEEPTAQDCLPFVARFAGASAPDVDIGLLLFPWATLSWTAFDTFAERVRRASGTTFLIAAFHPQGAERATNPHQAVSFLRRTPDPMLQFVRADVIARVKAAQPQASAAVGERNFRSVADGRLDGVVRAIGADRDATYARLRTG
jgi:hypothetical protein